ncbi:MAG: hypothetical protein AB7G15_12800 [Alphaproteobacteria bacterium]
MRKFVIRIARASIIGLCVSFIGVASKAEEVAADPCAAAVAKSRYDPVIAVPAAVRRQIEAYKRGWAELCAARGNASLHRLLVMAEAIQKAFDPILEQAANRPEQIEKAHDAISKQFPSFVPAFDGALIEYQYFAPTLEIFGKYASKGDADDRLFFRYHEIIFGPDAKSVPWIQRTWDHGGCWRFGEMDWPAYFAATKAVTAQAKGKFYVDRVREMDEHLHRMLAGLGQSDGVRSAICTCRDTGAVAVDLEKIQQLLPDDAKGIAARASIAKARQGIARRTIEVLSDQERPCAGG